MVPAAQIVLDDLGSITDDVRGVAAAGDALDGMAREVIHDRQRLAVLPVQPQHADLRINRSDAGDLFVGRKRIGVADVRFPAVLQFEPAILHDPVLMAAAGADVDGHHVLPRLLHGLDRPLCDIFPYHSVTMAGIDQDIRGLDLQLLLELRRTLAR